ncbi:GTPase-activating protein gyp7 [Sesamum angolense]|uniref:GTPase-activating protein gyp7 n=1 Tax=Sesamum angolense TaxID=2727404 RepID=A0AAE1VZ58_9LAMI|nr:GTPase-activating protein gyp7 [Sesamum angolense]
MPFADDKKQRKCGKGSAMSFQKESSIIRNIGEPCLHQSPRKIAIDESKMLKPDKWQASFDNDGKILSFQKVLKSITLGGVDPSIRQEVWEFLLGCYALNSTTVYRRQLRIARRERYSDLVKQCQMMESSIGTGSLADVVGFKVMDIRTRFKYDRRRDVEAQNGRISKVNSKNIEDKCVLDGRHSKKSYFCRKGQSCDFGDPINVRRSTTKRPYGSCRLLSSTHPYNYNPTIAHGPHEAKYEKESYMDISTPPVIKLWEKDNKDVEELRLQKDRSSKLRYKDAHMYGVQNSNNGHMNESNSSRSKDVTQFAKSKREVIYPNMRKSYSRSSNLECEREVLNKPTVSDAPETPTVHTTMSLEVAREEKVTDWLWTLQRIVVDVVRTDTHLEFYEDTRNLARMSDILAIYAWVDPTIGYCQGMSDLLSPFIILFEDNADAFWCFVMLLRRMRDNFKMEGLTGVMKQLQALSHILELTDKDMFSHLSYVGAESLHFAFRMLLVLFRRELSFNETLCMWEMIWAADFDVSLTCLLDENCPELLVVQLPKQIEAKSGEESIIPKTGYLKGGFPSKFGIVRRSIKATGIEFASTTPHCGLAKSFWSKNNHLQIPAIASLIRNGDDELPVFCVAAILIMNRQKIIRETYSVEDLIKLSHHFQLILDYSKLDVF